MVGIIVLIIVLLYFVIGFITILLHKPQDAMEGTLLVIPCLLFWPILALGWLVSRPFSN